MKRLLWILAWIAVAIWSLFAWGAYGLLDVFGAFALRLARIALLGLRQLALQRGELPLGKPEIRVGFGHRAAHRGELDFLRGDLGLDPRQRLER